MVRMNEKARCNILIILGLVIAVQGLVIWDKFLISGGITIAIVFAMGRWHYGKM